jgi:hypothetical protein
VRANIECVISNVDAPGRALKRTSIQGSSREASQKQSIVHSRVSREQAIDYAHDDMQRERVADTSSREESRRRSIAEGEADSAMGIAQKIYQLGSQRALKRTTSAIPGGKLYGRHPAFRLDRAQECPVVIILGYPLPPVNMMRALLEGYFDSVHWSP